MYSYKRKTKRTTKRGNPTYQTFRILLRSRDLWSWDLLPRNCRKHSYGNYIYIPNHDVGSELSSYRDLFWNTERLSGLLKKVDAVTVSSGLCHLEELSSLEKYTDQ
ncbi:hypothetical protein MR857_10215 [bacterium]|nr:hypothetical protein [bacterium]MDY3022796.1 hypothetical protein [Oliverpabstia sp.]